MPPETEADILLTHFDWTVARLGEMLRQEPSEYFRDAALQRFGLTCEMAFKCLNAFAGHEGAPVTHEEGFRWAARQGFFGASDGWREIPGAYSEISRKPGRERADAIFGRLAAYLACFRGLLAGLRSQPSPPPAGPPPN